MPNIRIFHCGNIHRRVHLHTDTDRTMKLFIKTAAAAATAMAIAAGSVHAESQTASYTKAELETIIHDYIVEHPEVLIEASRKLQQRQAEDAVKADERYLKTYADQLFKSKTDAVVGPEDAQNVIVEFSDYNCGYCKKSKKLFFELLKDSSYNIRYIFKEYPILGPGSEVAGKASLAVFRNYPEKFLDYHMAVINSNGRVSSKDDIKKITDTFGFDWSKIEKDMDSKEIKDIIERNEQLGAAMNVTGTPCYIINGEFVRGAPTSLEYIKTKLKK